MTMDHHQFLHCIFLRSAEHQSAKQTIQRATTVFCERIQQNDRKLIRIPKDLKETRHFHEQKRNNIETNKSKEDVRMAKRIVGFQDKANDNNLHCLFASS